MSNKIEYTNVLVFYKNINKLFSILRMKLVHKCIQNKKLFSSAFLSLFLLSGLVIMVSILSISLVYAQEDNKESIASTINNECKSKYDSLQDMKNAIPFLEKVVATGSPETNIVFEVAQCVLKNLKIYGELSNDQIVVAPALDDDSDQRQIGTGLDSALLNEEIQRLQELNEVEQDDITLSFLRLIDDCQNGTDSSGTIIGCQIAVYIALAGEVEEKLGITMEHDKAWEGKAPRIQEN
jgi:hypothetical protein